MSFTPTQQARIDYLRTSLRLQSPGLETDPAYKFSDQDLWDILTVVTPEHNAKYTIDTLPDSEFHFVVLLGKKEIYYRLSTSTAPFYPLSAEGAELKKNVRFDHYIALVKQVEESYEKAVKHAEESIFGQFGEVNTYEALSQGKHFTKRNYNLANKPTVELTVSGITSNSVNLDWTKFNKGLFNNYSIFVDTQPIIDEYAEYPLRQGISAKVMFTDIHRTKYRIEGLSPNTTYYICVISVDRNGLYGYAEQMITTLPPS